MWTSPKAGIQFFGVQTYSKRPIFFGAVCHTLLYEEIQKRKSHRNDNKLLLNVGLGDFIHVPNQKQNAVRRALGTSYVVVRGTLFDFP